MNNAKQRTLAASAGLVTLLIATTSFAQEADTTAEANAEAEGRVGLGLPGATPASTAAARGAAAGTDHDAVVGRLAVGYLGRSSVNVGVPGAAAGTGQGAVAAPVIGVRYWLDRGLGLDLGVGLAFESSSSETDGAEADGPTRWAMILHGGVPLALASSRHFTFQIVPEANVGFGGASTDTVDHSGLLIDLGARAGAEIQFGFVGLPELSLQGSVGVLFGIANAGSTTEAGGGEVEVSQSSMGFRTTVYDSPWNIFSSNVAALYYF